MQLIFKCIVRAASLLTLAFVFSGLWSCSTQKDSFVNRAYHSINAKYNGFWNARESFYQGVKNLEELHTDNYEQVLSIFRYGTEQDAASIRGNMDVTYEKASLVIRRHSMNIRGTEHNKWIDESYFLIARSHFFKRDYTLGILTFEHIIRMYDTKRAYDSKVWIAKSYNQLERYEQALRMFDVLERNHRDGLLRDETTALFRKAYADYYFRQGNFRQAASQLEKGLPYMQSRSDRVRMTFIQAQLYHHAGDYALAQQNFERVLGMRPDRNMAFQARIGMAMAYDPSVGGLAFIRSELRKMLDEDRNRLYRDQIYYALGQLALRDNDESLAVRMYNQSIEASVDNNMQKGLSFLRLGEIYFAHPDYLQASIFYDSATTFLPRSYDDFEIVSKRQLVLSTLTQLNQVIAREDSLQHLASLPEDQQKAAVDAIIADLREQERIREQEERERMQTMRDAGQMARHTRGMGDQDRSWYFYNTNAMANGEMEFFSRFGDRPLEDLWRISNKQMIAGGFGMDFMDVEGMESQEDTLELDEFDPQTYLRNIPNTEEQMQASRERKMRAQYNISIIFRDQLNDMDNAANSFAAVVRDYPGMELELPAYYHLYFLHRERNDLAAAELVKNDLLRLYPESEYAMIIGDPNYADRVRSRQRMVERLYEESYHAFLSGRHDIISRNRKALDTLEASRELRARFDYLLAISKGKNDDKAVFFAALQDVVDSHGGTQVHEPASLLLASLEMTGMGPGPGVAGMEGKTTRVNREPIDSPFSFSPDAVHFFILLVNTSHMDHREVNGAITAFNEVRETDGLSVSSIQYADDKQLITVTNFRNMEAGMEYFLEFTSWDDFPAGPEGGLQPFVISVDNYPGFYQDKELEEYRRFFDYYYLHL